MDSSRILFDESHFLEHLRHYLPAQAALKDFIHHNSLHAFQHIRFHEALNQASEILGYQTYLPLDEFRALYKSGKIAPEVLDRAVQERIMLAKSGKIHSSFQHAETLKDSMLHTDYPDRIQPRIGRLRKRWKSQYAMNLDKITHPLLFRLLSNYLDQGIALWDFPVQGQGFLDSLRRVELLAYGSLFKSKRARHLFLERGTQLKDLLEVLVGVEKLYERYLFDQQFAHPGWSGFVGVVEVQPQTLLDRRDISLRDLVILECCLEIDALDSKFGETWKPLGLGVEWDELPLFANTVQSECMEVLSVWQEAFEWSYFDDVLLGIQRAVPHDMDQTPRFQAVFCIDDREYSLRRYLEKEDSRIQTFGTPGFFGAAFYFQPEGGKFFTKACPAPVNPKHLIREQERHLAGHKRDLTYSKHSHQPVTGWMISQTLGLWAGIRLFWNIFRPTVSPFTAFSFRHMDHDSKLTVEHQGEFSGELQVGFTQEEMVERVQTLFMTIGMTRNFGPIVYLVGHGASSSNNTHYAGYDCGACCGRPGAVNARVMAFMANHKGVRSVLRERGIDIPDATVFIGCMHDTTRDELEYYDEQNLHNNLQASHVENKKLFGKVLDLNARERSRRFASINTKLPLNRIHEKVKDRSVSLFEPRPELNHATNALCIVGRSTMIKGLFLDRRAFMNSYDYRLDPDGKLLLGILNAAAPVCGGINLEYYFSRVDQAMLGAGTKLPHNVVGLFGVANGVEGDLRPGLPSQMIEMHDPVRLLFVIEQYPDIVLKTIQTNPATYEWFIHEWVLLAVKHPDTGEVYRFADGKFERFVPVHAQVNASLDVSKLILNTEENIPVLVEGGVHG